MRVGLKETKAGLAAEEEVGNDIKANEDEEGEAYSQDLFADESAKGEVDKNINEEGDEEGDVFLLQAAGDDSKKYDDAEKEDPTEVLSHPISVGDEDSLVHDTCFQPITQCDVEEIIQKLLDPDFRHKRHVFYWDKVTDSQPVMKKTVRSSGVDESPDFFG